MIPGCAALLVVALAATAPADSLRESAPAPLLVPGRSRAADSLRLSRDQLARQQYLKGRELERQGAGAAAILSYRQALRSDPTLPDANLRIGRLFLTVDQIGEAAAAFAAELEHHPGSTEAARELGLAWARLDEHERAIEQLELLTRRVPGDGESWRALGYAYLGAGRAADAEAALRRAIALPPPRVAEHRDLGFLLSTTGREDEARREYERALAIDSTDTATWVNLGNLDRRQGGPERALTDFRTAQRHDTTSALAVRGEAAVLMDLGRHEEAGAAYRHLLRLAPHDVEARFAAVRLFEALNRDDIALELARDGVRRDRGSSDARLILGMALEAQGRWREAAQELHRAEAFAPDSSRRERARGLLGTLRRQASDSLRVVFAADSVELARDLARRTRPPGRGAPGRAPSGVTAPAPAPADSLTPAPAPPTR